MLLPIPFAVITPTGVKSFEPFDSGHWHIFWHKGRSGGLIQTVDLPSVLRLFPRRSRELTDTDYNGTAG
jgi:hypothetical protein